MSVDAVRAARRLRHPGRGHLRTADEPARPPAAADAVGYPVVLKTAEPGHPPQARRRRRPARPDDADAVAAAYADLAARLGPDGRRSSRRCPRAWRSALGLWRDPLLGPLVLVAAGGSLVELLAERVGRPAAGRRGHRLARWSSRLRLAELLAGHRGRPAARRPTAWSPRSWRVLAAGLRARRPARGGRRQPAGRRSRRCGGRRRPGRTGAAGPPDSPPRKARLSGPAPGAFRRRTIGRGLAGTAARSGRGRAGCGRARRSGRGRGR